MKLHELTGHKRRRHHRVGRGIAAGQGKTAGRGTKGQKARSGYQLPRRFEGGQSSLIQRLPKQRGFRSLHAKAPTVRIDLILEKIEGNRLSPKILMQAGLVTRRESASRTIKIVGTSDKLRFLTVTKHVRFTKRLTAAMAEVRTGSKKPPKAGPIE